MNKNEVKKGVRVSWTYTHHLNSYSRKSVTKTGTIIGLGKFDQFGSFVKVKFDGNKHPAEKRMESLTVIQEATATKKAI